jgi:hypothetical protein
VSCWLGWFLSLPVQARLLYPQHRWRRWPAAWDRWTSALVSASHPAQASYPMQIKPHTDCIHRTARVGDGTPLEEVPGHSHFALRDWETRSLGPGPGFILAGVGSGTGVHASVGHSLVRLVANFRSQGHTPGRSLRAHASPMWRRFGC